MVGVWTAPVTAQLIIAFVKVCFPRGVGNADCPARRSRPPQLPVSPLSVFRIQDYLQHTVDVKLFATVVLDSKGETAAAPYLGAIRGKEAAEDPRM
jgi:hypothetical protein